MTLDEEIICAKHRFHASGACYPELIYSRWDKTKFCWEPSCCENIYIYCSLLPGSLVLHSIATRVMVISQCVAVWYSNWTSAKSKSIMSAEFDSPFGHIPFYRATGPKKTTRSFSPSSRWSVEWFQTFSPYAFNKKRKRKEIPETLEIPLKSC